MVQVQIIKILIHTKNKIFVFYYYFTFIIVGIKLLNQRIDFLRFDYLKTEQRSVTSP